MGDDFGEEDAVIEAEIRRQQELNRLKKKGFKCPYCSRKHKTSSWDCNGCGFKGEFVR